MEFSDNINEFNYVKDKKDNWEEYRDISDKYELREIYLQSVGYTKKILFLKEGKKREYEMLQCSRGLTLKENQKTIDDFIKHIEDNELVLCPYDLARVKDLEIEVDFSKVKSVFEMGFRVPKILKYYHDRGIKFVKGYDIVNLGVIAAKKMGFDAEQKDFNDSENLDLNDFKDADLILSYHMLEHVSRPDLLLENLFENMKSGAYLHAEVPIEWDGPYLKHGHLFPFWPMDIFRFATAIGFEVISATVNEWVRDLHHRINISRQGYRYGDPDNVYERYGTQRIYNYQYLILDANYRDQFGAQHPPEFVKAEDWVSQRKVGDFYSPEGERYDVIIPVGHPQDIDMCNRNNGFTPPTWMERVLLRKP
jgi:hypothetical protein